MLDAKTVEGEQQNKFLTDSDIESFAINGFVVKRGALDADLMQSAEDLMWETLGGHFVPDDPSSWRGVAKDCLGALPISDRYGKVKLRDEIWEHPALNNLLNDNPMLFSMMERLLGEGNVLHPDRSRGIYPIFPTPEHAHIPVHGHLDLPIRPFKIGVVAYFGDVPAGGGGFAVWPGSHRAFFDACKDDASAPANGKLSAFRKVTKEFDAHEPLELTGGPGDVILFHHLLMHAPTINSVEGQVRKAALCNYMTPDCVANQSKPRKKSIWDGWHGIDALQTPAIEASRTPAAADEFSRSRSIPAHSAAVDKMLRGVRKLSLGLKFRRALSEHAHNEQRKSS
ncbi:MAG: hypothetical protein AAFZ10_07860 [Pseudomonadota bacterium]